MIRQRLCTVRITLIISFIFLISPNLFSQQDDSTAILIKATNDTLIIDTINYDVGKGSFWRDSIHSPLKAGLFSTVIPGLGQAYNRKFWKMPIVYAALGTGGYFIISNYNCYNALKNVYNEGPYDGYKLVADCFGYNIAYSQILDAANEIKRYGDLSVIITSALYLFNIIDAVVDAHLYEFDISDDISMHIAPQINKNYLYGNNTNTNFGINIKLSLQ